MEKDVERWRGGDSKYRAKITFQVKPAQSLTQELNYISVRYWSSISTEISLTLLLFIERWCDVNNETLRPCILFAVFKCVCSYFIRLKRRTDQHHSLKIFQKFFPTGKKKSWKFLRIDVQFLISKCKLILCLTDLLSCLSQNFFFEY